MITTETQPKRGQLVYWKRNTTYSEVAFMSLVQMPKSPHAVKVHKAGEEYILKDCEVFPSIKEAFCDKHKRIIELLKVEGVVMAQIARNLCVPYSRVLTVNKQAKEYGIICPETKKD